MPSTPKRDYAIFLLAYRHGLRASEVGMLSTADLDLKQYRLRIHRLKNLLPVCISSNPMK